MTKDSLKFPKYIIAVLIASFLPLGYSTAYLKWTTGHPRFLLDTKLFALGQTVSGWGIAFLLSVSWFWFFGELFLRRQKDLIYSVLEQLHQLCVVFDTMLEAGYGQGTFRGTLYREAMKNLRRNSLSATIRFVKRFHAKTDGLQVIKRENLAKACIDIERGIPIGYSETLRQLTESAVRLRKSAIGLFGRAGLFSSFSLLLLYMYLSDLHLPLFSSKSLMLLGGGYLCGIIAGSMLANHIHKIFNTREM